MEIHDLSRQNHREVDKSKAQWTIKTSLYEPTHGYVYNDSTRFYLQDIKSRGVMTRRFFHKSQLITLQICFVDIRAVSSQHTLAKFVCVKESPGNMVQGAWLVSSNKEIFECQMKWCVQAVIYGKNAP